MGVTWFRLCSIKKMCNIVILISVLCYPISIMSRPHNTDSSSAIGFRRLHSPIVFDGDMEASDSVIKFAITDDQQRVGSASGMSSGILFLGMQNHYKFTPSKIILWKKVLEIHLN